MNQIILAYLELLMSPQVVFAGVLIITLFVFRMEIKSILNRLALIKWGAAELSIPQPPSKFSDEVDAAKDVAEKDP